jgi:hypothetical protein
VAGRDCRRVFPVELEPDVPPGSRACHAQRRRRRRAHFYKFGLDQPASFAPGVTARDVAFEVDAYTAWKITRTLTASFVLALANRQATAQQAFDRTRNVAKGMVFLASCC